MTEPDRKALAFLALWARLCCAPIRRPWLKLSGFDAGEWSRLLELAAAVDRRTLLRFGGANALMMAGSILIGTALMIGIILLTFPMTLSPVQKATSVAAGTLIMVIVVALIYRVAADFAVRGRWADALVSQPGDAALIAKWRRQNVKAMGITFAGAAVVSFLFGLFGAPLLSFMDQWNWLVMLLAVMVVADYVWRIWRGPRSIPPL